MSISEQVKELRAIANNLSIGHNMPISLAVERFRESADTIESLSAKLADKERPAEDCGGGWIKISDRVPIMEECQNNDNRFILDDGNRRYGGLFDYQKRCFVQFDFWKGLVEDKCAIAWQPLPEPCHEP